MKKLMTFAVLLILNSILSWTMAADVLPEAGKTYLIKSDNVDAQKQEQDYYLYNDNGTLKLSAYALGDDNYLWTCEKEGDNFRFKNKAGKYLGHKAMNDAAYDFKIDPAKKVNEGCLPLYAVKDNRYMLVKNGGGAFDQADKTYNKAVDGFSSDYIFEEFSENDRMLTVLVEPAGSPIAFSWNGENHNGICNFIHHNGEAINEATLSAQMEEDPASLYEFLGFFEGDQNLGKTVEISSLEKNRVITAKFNFNPYSSTYGEKWLRITWNSNKSYVMGLPVSASYANVAPKTITSDLGTETQLWCFVGTAESFKIYNKAAGKDLALATASTNYGDGTATFMKAEATATFWHLVSNNGWNISPAGNTSWGLNSYAGVGNALKLYNNGDGGNIWTFEKAGENALTFQVVINGTPKALNTNIGQLSMSLGSMSKTINVTTSQTEPQKFYLANKVKLGFMLSGTQYRGYKFEGFRINDGELLNSIEDLPFDASLKTITVVYDVDTEDPSQYLFYTPGYQGHPYRIPAIVTTKDDKLLAISDFRWDGADIGMGAVDLVGRISEDNGATWSEQFNIAVGNRIPGDKKRGYGDAAVVTDRESGRILIMCCTGSVFYSNGTRENPLRSARLYSEDNGKTWSKPEDITDQMYALLPQSTGQFIGAGKICQSRVTKVGEYYRLYAALCTRSGNFVIYSDDFGQTWAVLGSNETSCAPNGDEPKCEELPDGSVVLSSRKYSGRYFNIYKYTDVATAAGAWQGVVSSNDIEGGLRVGNNSTNGEIQLVKVMNKESKSLHYMLIQSLPYGAINSGDEARSNVAIYYKVLDGFTLDTPTELATGWTQGMVFQNAKGAYSTMCIQPDNKLGFFYEEGPNNYCMVYRPISIEELTGDTYTMYDGEIDKNLLTLNGALTKAKTYTIGTTTGTYADLDGSLAKAMQDVQNAIDNGTADLTDEEVSALTTALQEAIDKLTLNMPQAGKYYRFVGSTGAYLSSTGAFQGSNKPGRMMMTNTADANTVFYLTADNRLITPNATGVFEYFIEREGNGFGSDFTFEDAGNGRFYVVTEHTTHGTNGRGSWYATAAGQPVDRWTKTYNQKAECAWIIEEVTDAELQLTREIGNTGYATLAAPVTLNIPAGVKAYTVTVDEAQETAILEEVSEVIPAGTAVVLKKEGTESSFDFTYAPEGSTENSNSLVGVYKTTNITTDINAYILGNGSEGIGFYQMSADDRTLGSNKAYLELPASMSHIRSITIGGPTTGIEDTVAEGAEAEEYYDLQGRRVMNPVKGIYVTKSGKKVLFNK